MRLVRQKDRKTSQGGKSARRRLPLLLAALLAASGCATGAQDAGEGAGPSARASAGAQGAPGPAAAAPKGALELDREAAKAAAERAIAERARVARERKALVAASRRWGLKQPPMIAPPPPADKVLPPTRTGFEVRGQEDDALPPVFTTVPTTDRVVFLTIDDGDNKDPETLRMLEDLHIPYSAFLSDYLVSDDYGYFREARDKGMAINNHTLHHRYLPALSHEEQREEICGMQDILGRQYGKRPELFRPPYGNYNRDTLLTAKSCGVRAVPLWNAEVFPGRWEYREADQDLHPGDIVLTHFQGRAQWKGTMPDALRTFLRTVTEKGYAVARLEDYV